LELHIRKSEFESLKLEEKLLIQLKRDEPSHHNQQYSGKAGWCGTIHKPWGFSVIFKRVPEAVYVWKKPLTSRGFS